MKTTNEKKKSIKNFYHDQCNDGVVAAWVAQRHLTPKAEVVCEGLRHGEPFTAEGFDEVMFLDICPPHDQLQNLAEKCEVVVVDHHKTPCKKLAELQDKKYDLIYTNNFSGAGLTWIYVNFLRKQAGSLQEVEKYLNLGTLSKKMPTIVEIVQARDLWKASELEEQASAYLRPRLPKADEETFNFLDFLENTETLETLAAKGAIPLENEELQAEKIVEASFIGEIRNHVLPLVNAPIFLSSLVAKKMMKKYETGMEMGSTVADVASRKRNRNEG